MQHERSHVDFTGQAIFVGLDVHKKSWRVSIHTEMMEYKTFTQPPHTAPLLAYLTRSFPGARFQCAYEAGFSGYGIAHALRAHGVECLVVHPPDIPTTDHDRKHKNDGNDARRLGRELRNGTLRSIYIPPQVAIEDRALLRTRHGFIKKLTRTKTQIRMVLLFLGIRIPPTFERSYWSRRFITWLEARALESESGTTLLQALVRELLFQRDQVAALTRQIRRLAQTDRYRAGVKLLMTVPGIGPLTAMTLVTEVMEIGRFPSSDTLASYVGLVPGEASSGEKTRSTGLSKRRNAHLRRVLIESAWTAIRNDPALLSVYHRASRRMAKSQAIVIVARRLLNRLRQVWLTGMAYERGIARGRFGSSDQDGKAVKDERATKN